MNQTSSVPREAEPQIESRGRRSCVSSLIFCYCLLQGWRCGCGCVIVEFMGGAVDEGENRLVGLGKEVDSENEDV